MVFDQAFCICKSETNLPLTGWWRQVREGLTECWAVVRDKVEFAENGEHYFYHDDGDDEHDEYENYLDFDYDDKEDDNDDRRSWPLHALYRLPILMTRSLGAHWAPTSSLLDFVLRLCDALE